MKREALQRINRRANEMTVDEAAAAPVYGGFGKFGYSDDRKAKEWISERAEML
jgi:hypothetical protein